MAAAYAGSVLKYASLRLKPNMDATMLLGKSLDLRVVPLNGFVVLAALHVDPVFRARQFIHQTPELLIGFQLRIVLHDDQQPAECAFQLLVGLDLLLRRARSGHLGAALAMALNTPSSLRVPFDGVHQVGNEVGAALQSDVHLRPGSVDGFPLADQFVTRAHERAPKIRPPMMMIATTTRIAFMRFFVTVHKDDQLFDLFQILTKKRDRIDVLGRRLVLAHVQERFERGERSTQHRAELDARPAASQPERSGRSTAGRDARAPQMAGERVEAELRRRSRSESTAVACCRKRRSFERSSCSIWTRQFRRSTLRVATTSRPFRTRRRAFMSSNSMGKQSAELRASSSLMRSGAGCPSSRHQRNTDSESASSRGVTSFSTQKMLRSEYRPCTSPDAAEPYKMTETRRSP